MEIKIQSTFEVYFEIVRNRAKSSSNLEKKKKREKKKREREKESKIVLENVSWVMWDWGKTNSDRAIRLDRMSMSGVVNFIGHRAFPIRAFSHRWTRAPWSETFSPRCYIKARGRSGHHETDPRYLGEYCTLR